MYKESCAELHLRILGRGLVRETHVFPYQMPREDSFVRERWGLPYTTRPDSAPHAISTPCRTENGAISVREVLSNELGVVRRRQVASAGILCEQAALVTGSAATVPGPYFLAVREGRQMICTSMHSTLSPLKRRPLKWLSIRSASSSSITSLYSLST